MGRKPKKPFECPNPLFLKWLEEWRDDARAKGSKLQHPYGKALSSMRKYPLPLQCGKDAMILEGVGESIAQKLDGALGKYLEEHGGQAASQPQRQDFASTAAAGYHSSTMSAGPSSLHVPPPDDHMDPQPAPKKSRQKKQAGKKEYVPGYRTGPYALILTLYRQSQKPTYRGYMNREDLQREAQNLCDTSFTIPDPGTRYTAWSSMSTLTKKGFVIKTSSPARYSITDEGCAMAHRLEQVTDPSSSSSQSAVPFVIAGGAAPALGAVGRPLPMDVDDDSSDDNDDIMISQTSPTQKSSEVIEIYEPPPRVPSTFTAVQDRQASLNTASSASTNSSQKVSLNFTPEFVLKPGSGAVTEEEIKEWPASEDYQKVEELTKTKKNIQPAEKPAKPKHTTDKGLGAVTEEEIKEWAASEDYLKVEELLKTKKNIQPAEKPAKPKYTTGKGLGAVTEEEIKEWASSEDYLKVEELTKTKNIQPAEKTAKPKHTTGKGLGAVTEEEIKEWASSEDYLKVEELTKTKNIQPAEKPAKTGKGLGAVTKEEIKEWAASEDYLKVEELLKTKNIQPAAKPAKPNSPSLQPDDYHVLVYDLETTGLRKDAEITQIACIGLNDDRKFSRYITPNGRINRAASKVTGLSVRFSKGVRRLHKNRKALPEAGNRETALRGLSGFLKSYSDKPILLIAHNCHAFDAPRLVSNIHQQQLTDEFPEGSLYFGDSLIAARKLYKSKDRLKLGDLYNDAFHADFNAHDALADCRALKAVIHQADDNLKQIICQTAMPWSYYSSINAYEIRLQAIQATYDGNISSANTVNRLSELGVKFSVLRNVYAQCGQQAMVSYLAGKCQRRVRVTNNVRDICEIVKRVSDPRFSQNFTWAKERKVPAETAQARECSG